MAEKSSKQKVTSPKVATKLAKQLKDPKTPKALRTGPATGVAQADGIKSNNKSTDKASIKKSVTKPAPKKKK